MIHTGNIIFDIYPRQLNWLGLRPVRYSPYDVPPGIGHLQRITQMGYLSQLNICNSDPSLCGGYWPLIQDNSTKAVIGQVKSVWADGITLERVSSIECFD